MRHRFLPPPASLPHERLANEVRDQDILEEEPSNTSLDTQGAQQHQPRYPGSPATPAWIPREPSNTSLDRLGAKHKDHHALFH